MLTRLSRRVSSGRQRLATARVGAATAACSGRAVASRVAVPPAAVVARGVHTTAPAAAAAAVSLRQALGATKARANSSNNGGSGSGSGDGSSAAKPVERIVVLSKVSLIERVTRAQHAAASGAAPAAPSSSLASAAGAAASSTAAAVAAATSADGLPAALPALDMGDQASADVTQDLTAQRAHREHSGSVASVHASLQRMVARGAVKDVRFVEHLTAADVSWADLVVSVGGDGTFIRASHSVDDHNDKPLFGVNSSPSSSFGFYCAATAATFEQHLTSVLHGELPLETLHRMRARINGQPLAPPVLNEALFAAQSPAASSRYVLTNAGSRQFQCSSGIWVATAAGSTAAIHSAGGTIQALSDRRLQYRVRELFVLALQTRPNVGGFVADDFEIQSRMRTAHLFLDGCFHPQTLRFGDRVTFAPLQRPLRYFVTGTQTHTKAQHNKRRVSNPNASPSPSTA